MNFIVLNVLKSSIETQNQTCGVAYMGTPLPPKMEEVEMAINTANINFCESTGKNTSRLTFAYGASVDVLCPFEDLLAKLNPQVQ